MRTWPSWTTKICKEHLIEVQYYSKCFNRYGKPEVDFFIAGRKFWEPLQKLDFSVLSAASLRDAHAALSQQFTTFVPPELRRDDPNKVEWRQLMLTELQPLEEDRVLEEKLLGMAPSSTGTSSGCPAGGSSMGNSSWIPSSTMRRLAATRMSSSCWTKKPAD